MKDERAKRTRRRTLRTAPMRAFSNDFLIGMAALGVERWDRLDVREQKRFRKLARAGGDAPHHRLSREEYRELLALWKRMEVQQLVREGIRRLAGREAK